MSIYLSHSQNGKIIILQLANMLSWRLLLFATIFFQARITWNKILVRVLQLLWLQEEVQLKTYLTKKMQQILMTLYYEVS